MFHSVLAAAPQLFQAIIDPCDFFLRPRRTMGRAVETDCVRHLAQPQRVVLIGGLESTHGRETLSGSGCTFGFVALQMPGGGNGRSKCQVIPTRPHCHAARFSGLFHACQQFLWLALVQAAGCAPLHAVVAHDILTHSLYLVLGVNQHAVPAISDKQQWRAAEVPFGPRCHSVCL